MDTKTSKIQQSGNSKLLYIPEDVIRELDLKKFDTVKVDIENNSIVIRKLDAKINSKTLGIKAAAGVLIANGYYETQEDAIFAAMSLLLHETNNGTLKTTTQMIAATLKDAEV